MGFLGLVFGRELDETIEGLEDRIKTAVTNIENTAKATAEQTVAKTRSDVNQALKTEREGYRADNQAFVARIKEEVAASEERVRTMVDGYRDMVSSVMSVFLPTKAPDAIEPEQFASFMQGSNEPLFEAYKSAILFEAYRFGHDGELWMQTRGEKTQFKGHSQSSDGTRIALEYRTIISENTKKLPVFHGILDLKYEERDSRQWKQGYERSNGLAGTNALGEEVATLTIATTKDDEWGRRIMEEPRAVFEAIALGAFDKKIEEATTENASSAAHTFSIAAGIYRGHLMETQNPAIQDRVQETILANPGILRYIPAAQAPLQEQP